ncbi:MAG: hypothetical protein IKP76_04590 [Bacilli bacterium]|nr:hypothetical protein [Bacilli bacterium]
MEKIKYVLKNGKVDEYRLGTGESNYNGSYYLSVSTMFDDVVPMKVSDKPVSLMESFMNQLKMKDYQIYNSLINRLMGAVITAKDADDLCDVTRENSFYKIITNAYRVYCNSHNRKVDKLVFNNSIEYMATLSRLSIRRYMDDFFNSVEDTNRLKKLSAFDALKVSNKRMSAISNSRLKEDEKLSGYINNLYIEGLNRFEVDSKDHKCFKCHWKRTTDCPKLSHVGIDAITIDNPILKDMLIDATQVVSITEDEEGNKKVETDSCIVRDCRRYRYFEQKYNEEHKDDESKYVKEQSSKDVKTLKRILTDKK